MRMPYLKCIAQLSRQSWRKTGQKQGSSQFMTKEEISEEDDNTVVNIPICFDGTWSKRGYTVNHGIGFVISVGPFKVLDYVIISKVCNTCIQKKIISE